MSTWIIGGGAEQGWGGWAAASRMRPCLDREHPLAERHESTASPQDDGGLAMACCLARRRSWRRYAPSATRVSVQRFTVFKRRVELPGEGVCYRKGGRARDCAGTRELRLLCAAARCGLVQTLVYGVCQTTVISRWERRLLFITLLQVYL